MFEDHRGLPKEVAETDCPEKGDTQARETENPTHYYQLTCFSAILMLKP